jgi:hypothetical protein
MFEFEVCILEGLTPDNDRYDELLYDAGFDDSTVAVFGGQVRILMNRDGETFDAVSKQVEQALAQIGVTKIEINLFPDPDTDEVEKQVTRIGKGDSTTVE